MIEQALHEHGYEDAEVSGRPKHFYSIHQKMEKRNLTFDQIYDVTGFRVLVETVEQCYGVLGIIHSLWTPVPGRFKDYIAIPKANFYQSLHTTVIGPGGERDRNSDPHASDMHDDGGTRDRRALGLQRRRRRPREQESSLAESARGVEQRSQGSERVSGNGEARSLHRGRLRLYPSRVK